MKILEKIQPDKAGVPSDALCRFFYELDKLPFDMHSVAMARRGKLILETYYAPYKPDDLHRMFSVTKSLISLAIGCLANDGKINLDNPITEYFPEYPTMHEFIQKTTLRNMLMMRSPHEKTTYKADLTSDWVESFFITEPSHKSGTVFSYDSSATHVLGALVEKLTGMPFLDYLREKFLDKIGFSKEAYCIQDPFGVSMGGSGLMAHTIDLIKIACLILNGGKYMGKQLIDADYLSAATSFLSPTDVRGGFADEMKGYGMYFWRTRNNSFMLYGMGGQLALCIPDKDFIFVTTADTIGYPGGVQAILDTFWREIYSRLDTDCVRDTEKLEKILKSRRIRHAEGESRTLDAKYSFEENALNLLKMHVISDKNGGSIEYTCKSGTHTIHFKTGGFYNGIFEENNCPYIASGAWNKNMLRLKLCLLGETLGHANAELVFDENDVTVSVTKTDGISRAIFYGRKI